MMYVEARKRTTTWWLGRVAIAFTVVLATALMLLGVSRGAAMSSMPVSEAGSNPVAPIASIATITGTAISTPVPPPGCEIGWEPVTHPGGGLLGVTALNASEAWIGGTGRVLSWNGARWAATPLPTQIPNVILERDSASTGNNVWGRSSAGAVRWDGANWNLIPYPTPTPPPPPYTNRYDFASIGAASPYDVWLTGGYYDDNDGDHPAVIFHWNGVQWNLIPFVSGEEGNTASPSTPEHPAGGYATYSSVGSVAIAGRDEMWAISSTSPPPWANYPSYSIMHVTPAGARYVPSPYPQGAYHSIAVAGPNDVWVFGRVQGSTGSSLILHWDGSTFTEVAHPGVGSFTGSEAIAPNNVWAATADGDFLHWDGSTWSVESVHTANTWRLAASGPYDVWAVGISAQATPVLLHYPDLPTFTDVPLDNTFYANIRCLACRGIVSGYADGTFRPNNDVTRGQLAKIVSSAAGFTESPDPQIFEDVAPTSTFYQWVNRLSRRGYMGGYACGGVGEPCTTGMPYFRPSANATRGQTSKIVSNTAGYTEEPTEQAFEDVPPSHTFYREIQRLASRNIMGGYPCGGVGEPCLSGKPYFRPQNNVTRGQSAKIVANTFFPGCQTP